MPNHNKQIVSKEDKEEYNSKAYAQELLRARVDDYSQDNSLPWEEGKKTTTPLQILSGSYISRKKRAISNKRRNRN